MQISNADMKFTRRQGEYLSFMHQYRLVQGRSPAESEIANFIGVSAPSAHQMIVSLERKGLISRIPGVARSIRVLVDPRRLPSLEGQEVPSSTAALPRKDSFEETVVTVIQRIVDELCEENEVCAMDDREFIPLLRRLLVGVEKGLSQVGAGPLVVERVRELVCAHAEGQYVSMCAKHDPESADSADDAFVFRHLMLHGDYLL